jgi:hypothetical protein
LDNKLLFKNKTLNDIKDDLKIKKYKKEKEIDINTVIKTLSNLFTSSYPVIDVNV